MKKTLLICLFLFVASLNIYAISFEPTYNMRLRYNFYDIHDTNAFNSNFIRFRNSIGLRTHLDEDSKYNFYVSMLNENFYYFYNTVGKSDDYIINEFIFDQLYFEAKDLFNEKLNLKIGRQNLSYGEKFLIAEGTPSDGSRTGYFNAVKVGVILPIFDFDFIGHSGTLYDQYLPVLNRNEASRVNSDYEKSVMIFGKSNFSKELYLEPYYIYKSEENINHYRQINTFGSYIKYDKNDFTLRTQLSTQVKEEKNHQANAFGGYLFVDNKNILFDDKITIGGIYLSGKKQDTSVDEGWNDLFSRATEFIKSDVLGVLYIPETGICAYWTNLQLYNIEYNVNITEKLSASISFNLLYANENVEGTMFGNGKNRGNLTLAGLYYKVNEHIKTSLYSEYMTTGDFYNRDLVKDGMYTKAEITMSF